MGLERPDWTSNPPPPGEEEGAARLWAPRPELAASHHLLNPDCGPQMAFLMEGSQGQGSLDRWRIPGLGKGKHKMNLEHFVLPESQEGIRDYAGWVTRLSGLPKGAPRARDETISALKKGRTPEDLPVILKTGFKTDAGDSQTK